MEYPASLLAKLAADTDSLHSSLSSGAAVSSTAPTRDLATRKLLASTPEAIDTLRNLMNTGDDKVRLGAASKLLDKSPAVDQTPTAAVAALPPEALSSILETLSSFAKAALSFAPQERPAEYHARTVPADEVASWEPVIAPRKRAKGAPSGGVTVSSTPIKKGAKK